MTNPELPVTASRLGRLTQLGRLAGSIAGGALGEGARQFVRGARPSFGELLLTSANAQRLANRLSEMRGAAMKIGQLLSLEAGEILPPALSHTLARLRDNAHIMPLGQVAQVLNHAWGENWDRDFRRFSFTPIAAASIGQVHKATLDTGGHVAVKIQYPGIRESIDSDIDNVSTLLRLTGLLPEDFDLTALLEEAKRELHFEADYLEEARNLERFQALLSDDHRFQLPSVVRDLTTPEVLTMGYLDGEPIEVLLEMEQALRDSAGSALLELGLSEVFCWGLVQTDPNFANYRYHRGRQQLQLLDFGATRQYSPVRKHSLKALLHACYDGADSDVETAASKVGYMSEDDPQHYRSNIVALLRTATEPLRAKQQPYTVGSSNLVERMSEVVLKMRLREKSARIPPLDVLYLHRKLGGLYMLLSRLGAKIHTQRVLQPFLNPG
ncbi:MAG: AarF/ABC1/UbiB kinase family protein [Gammaproteobacteria bacterium]|jgi:predicted unusual protein kinase regulating ubiquinone biosynthesis (AarF/ABC1/UbiB family)|nr:AarF/ABC1/UbiB kinase family protein [Gammaproteobacteria bacterium]